MMIQIKLESQTDFVKVFYEKTRLSGVKYQASCIEARPKSDAFPAAVNIQSTGDLETQDIPEFLEAVRLAEMIASGQIEFTIDLLPGREAE